MNKKLFPVFLAILALVLANIACDESGNSNSGKHNADDVCVQSSSNNTQLNCKDSTTDEMYVIPADSHTMGDTGNVKNDDPTPTPETKNESQSCNAIQALQGQCNPTPTP